MGSNQAHPVLGGAGLQVVAMAVGLCGLVLIVWPTSHWVPAAGGISLLVSGAVPLVMVARRPDARLGRRLLLAAILVAVVPVGLKTVAHIDGSFDVRTRDHDGGVLVTRAAAEDVLAGRNPYVVDHRSDLPERWHQVQAPDGELFTNPVMEHYPYLPAAALVHLPFVAAADISGLEWDPRLLTLGLLVATIAVVARRDDQVWARAATIFGLGNGFAVLTAAWGTNDLLVACLVLLTCLVGERRPRLAGGLLAVAIACKFLMILAVLPLAVVLVDRRGWSGLRRWWTLPAVLMVTTLPWLAVSPRALVDDTVAFNLGLTDVRMPASGIGLPVVFPSVSRGPLLLVLTLATAVTAVVLCVRIVRRWPTLLAVPVATAVGLWFVLWPARTFQETYLTLVVTLLAPAWLLIGHLAGPTPGGRITNGVTTHERSA